jgi:regulator of protease activity HflC (stomatin/prohibitin superfamily)
MRTITQAVTASTITLLFAVGCESAADQQRKANEAQAEANEDVARAQVDADRTAREAQAKADRDISEAQEKFSKIREEFRHDFQSKLLEVDKEIADLRTKSATEGGKKKEKLDANLPVIDDRRARFVTAFDRLQEASATTWDETKNEVEKRWQELKNAVDAAT